MNKMVSKMENRFIKTIYIDGFPILDQKTGILYNNFDKTLLVALLNELAEKADRADSSVLLEPEFTGEE